MKISSKILLATSLLSLLLLIPLTLIMGWGHAVFILIGFLIEIGFFWFLIYFLVIKRINNLDEIADEIAKGNLQKRVVNKSSDELGMLANSLNEMASSLQESQQFLEKRISQKTAELMNSQALLEERNRDLEESRTAMLNLLEDVDTERQISIARANDLIKFQLAVENASDQIVITDPEAIILYANKAVEITTGFPRLQVLGQKAGLLWGKQMDLAFYQNMWKTIKTDKKVYNGEITNKRMNGVKYIAQISISPILNDNREVVYFVGIERDITKAKEIDRMKTEFISIASHQLRTPLSAAKWFTEMLLHGDVGEIQEKQKEFIENINKANIRMIELVNFLLDISKIESGKISVEPELTNLNDLLNEVIFQMQELVVKKQINVTLEPLKDFPVVNVDPQLLKQIYVNILSNAFKYTPEKGSVNASIYIEGNDIITKISDSGYGIPEAEKDRIFQKFYRGSNILQIETEGTGLGLYLVKLLIGDLGAKIWFESQQDHGTTFWIALPLAGSKQKKSEI